MLPNEIVNNTLADADEVQENFEYLDDLTNSFLNGWIEEENTLTYASATSFTISSVDLTDVYTKGTKIRLFNDGSTKYYYVTSSSFSTNTTVNIVGEDDLVSGTITLPYYSYSLNPQGFTQWMSWDLSFDNITVGNGTLTAKFCIIGSSVFCRFELIFGSTTSLSGAGTFSLPVDANSDYNAIHHCGIARLQDATGADGNAPVGISSSTRAYIVVNKADSTYLTEVDLSSTIPFTWATSDVIKGSFFYEMA